MRRASFATHNIGKILVVAGLTGIGTNLLYSFSTLRTQDDSWQAHVVTPLRPLTSIGDNLWQVTGPLKPGSTMERNMVIYKLPNKITNNENNNEVNSTTGNESKENGLLLHSVIAFDDATMKQIESLGKPSIIIVPSPYHRSDAAVYKQRYPEARILCPQEIAEQVATSVPVDGSARKVLKHEYGIQCLEPKGGLHLPELVYKLPYRNTEGTDTNALVFCDLLVNLRTGPWYMKLMQGITGGTDPRMTFIWKRFVTKDRTKMKEFWHELATSKDVSALLMAHGDPVVSDPETISKKLGLIAEQL
jgi:hypothetical protein